MTDKEKAVASTWGRSRTNEMFHDILKEVAVMHDAKSHDYGTSADPLSNIRASEAFNVPPWVGALIRGNDKIVRIQSFLSKGNLVFESVEDSLLDHIVYSVIALQLYRETQR